MIGKDIEGKPRLLAPPRSLKRGKDRPVLRSRKDSLGQIRVQRLSGVARNTASLTIREFEHRFGQDREDLADKLEAATRTHNESERALITALRNPRNRPKSLALLIAQSRASAGAVITNYAKGALALGQAEAITLVAKGLPDAARHLVAQALPKSGPCRFCLGTGIVVRGRGDIQHTCGMCKGKGIYRSLGDKFIDAFDRMAAVAELGGKSGPLVQQNVVVAGGGGAGLMERLVRMSDEIIYRAKDKVIEAEARVLPPADPAETPDSGSSTL